MLAGITWVSSSGVIAKVLGDLGRLGNRETPVILSVLVIEDLAMAFYLPLVTAVLAGVGLIGGLRGAGGRGGHGGRGAGRGHPVRPRDLQLHVRHATPRRCCSACSG